MIFSNLTALVRSEWPGFLLTALFCVASPANAQSADDDRFSPFADGFTHVLEAPSPSDIPGTSEGQAASDHLQAPHIPSPTATNDHPQPDSELVAIKSEYQSPEGYLQAIREAMSREQWEEAERYCQGLLQDHPQLPAPVRKVVCQFWLLSLLPQNPLPASRIEAALLRLDAEKAFTDEAVWNLGVRLLLRQVVAAESPEQKLTLWQNGLQRLALAATDLRLLDRTLTELDGFLALPEPDRVVGPVTVLANLLTMGLDISTQRRLLQRKIICHQQANQSDVALDAAWVHLVLNMGTNGEPITALDQYVTLARERGQPRIEEQLIEPQSTGDSDWQALSSGWNGNPNRSLVSQEPQRLRVLLSVVRGAAAEGMVTGHRALATAPVDELWRHFDGLGMLAVRGTRDLRSASEPLRWHLRRLTPTPAVTPLSGDQASTGDSGNLSLTKRLQESWDQAVASAADTTDGWIHESDYVQRLVLRNQLQRRSDVTVGWAAAALDAGRPDLSALFWGQALTDAALAQDPNDPAPESLDRAVKALADILRGLEDPDLAVTMIGRVDRDLHEPVVRVPVLFLGATLLYEQGRMTDCLVALDRIDALGPSWDDSQRLGAGLVRAVAQLKLGRFDDAESVLAELAGFNGENEVMAQVAFLRGWIHLNRNENAAALDRFRDLVATYPGTRYAAQTRELIRRLEAAPRN